MSQTLANERDRDTKTKTKTKTETETQMWNKLNKHSLVASYTGEILIQCHSIPPNVVEPTPSHTSLTPTSSLSTPSMLQSHQPQPFASASRKY